MKNIVIVGFMGTGKTAVSRVLADVLNMRLVSTDDMIEERENMAINEIFTEKGEPYFRKAESEVIGEVSRLEDAVIDAGGGVVLNAENVNALKKNGLVFCLNATPYEILERTSRYQHRPLLKVADPLGKIKDLLEKRKEYYESADFQIDTSRKGIQGVADEIIQIYRNAL